MFTPKRAARRTAGPGDSGAAAVEFALVSVLLLLLLFGVISFGIALFRQQAASHAAREGARLASVGIGTGRPITTCAAFSNEVKSRGEGANITTVTLGVTEASGNATLGVGDLVTVSVTHTMDMSLVGSLIPGIPQTITLTQSGKARVEVLGSVSTC
jgi:Flp pilus assembly protein TadG